MFQAPVAEPPPPGGVSVYSQGFGRDTITDFRAGAGTEDRIELRGSYRSFDELRAGSYQEGGDTIIKGDPWGMNSIRLVGVQLSTLHADDFILVA